ncbi:MAG TPA: BolA/IbaG family iron-sulfur metabolism protein [Steroidobacteraceae bacterium]|nr:BolA/IbaG family iron-sulfur metabolism protein [Steroidobacteraceae bacterium]
MNAQQVAELIRQSLPQARIEVRSDDDTHFAATLVSAAFEGLRPLARHQLVYRALGERVGREIHALSIEAFTPAEWSARHAAGASPGGPDGGRDRG